MAKEDEAARRPYRWFSSDDLRWLVRLGYAEERVIRGVHVYRLTPIGAVIQPLIGNRHDRKLKVRCVAVTRGLWRCL